MPDVTTINKDYNNAFKQLPGIPVQWRTRSGKLKFVYPLQASAMILFETKFDIPKSGFVGDDLRRKPKLKRLMGEKYPGVQQ